MQDAKIAIIGAGNMGKAMLAALQTKFRDAAAFDKDDDLALHIPDANVIIIAVKPQDFETLTAQLTTKLPGALAGKLVISIMAGVTISRIHELTGADAIVRSMPNLPLKVQAGVTGWMASEGLAKSTDFDKDLVRKIFRTFGEEIEVAQENDLNKITPLSGSGPAYFFYLCELMQRKAEAMGFSKEDARKIAENTFTGTAKLLQDDTRTAAEMRAAVTSKGGTTEAALKHFEAAEFPRIFDEAIDANAARAAELNRPAA